MLDLTVEAFSQDSSYCSSTVDDPELLAKVGKHMFRRDVTVTPMFIVDDERCDWVTFGQDQLVFRICWKEGLSKTTTYSHTSFVIEIWT